MRISLTKFNCQIVLSQPDLNALADFCSKNRGSYSRCALLADHSLYPVHGEVVTSILKAHDLPVHPILLPKGEAAKTLETAEKCWEEMANAGIDRKSFVISLGGGTVSDIAGYVSACYMRGIDVVHIPTTLLAMVDASIGGNSDQYLLRQKSGRRLSPSAVSPHRASLSPPAPCARAKLWIGRSD